MNNTLIVAKYEYLRTVKKASFWLATISVPLLMGVLIFISGFASFSSAQKLEELSSEIDEIAVIDETGLIKSDALKSPYKLITDSDKQAQIERVKKHELPALFFYPRNLGNSESVNDTTIEIYSKYDGLFSGSAYEGPAAELIEQAAENQINSPRVKTILTSSLKQDNTFFDENGNEAFFNFADLIFPIVSLLAFFIIVFTSAQYLLQSVSEEKENRMIETILSIINSRDLIYGKTIGLSLVVITQLLAWAVLGTVFTLLAGVIIAGLAGDELTNSLSQSGNIINTGGANNALASLPFDKVSQSIGDSRNLSFSRLLLNFYYIFMGVLLFAGVMVGAGSLGTTYKDSQSLSSPFILVAIFPIYFITLLLSDPNGTAAMIASYFPLTSPLVLLIRNSLGALSPAETIISILVVFIYVVGAFWLSVKLFDLGALMYNRRPTWKEVVAVLKK